MSRMVTILQPGKDGIYNITVNDRIAQGVAETLVCPQPGMFITEPRTGAQLIAPVRGVDILIELVIQITFHALLLQLANGTARFAAGFQQVIDCRTRQWTIDPFEKECRS